MKKYRFEEIKGKLPGEVFIVEAENANEACEKFGITEKIKDYEKFSTIDFSKTIYELCEYGDITTIYICRK